MTEPQASRETKSRTKEFADRGLFGRLRTAAKWALSPTQRDLMKRVAAPLFRRNLNKLANLYGTDKCGRHWYTQHYQRHFAPIRQKRLNILEIGVGGYDNPKEGGESLRMWRTYFPKGMIYAIDIHDKSSLEEARIKIFRGSQDDPKFLQDVAARIGRIDIIIDDGSHFVEHVRKTFEVLFPLLDDYGIYAIEDLQTSYWPEFGGNSEELTSHTTSVGMLKGLIDSLNYSEMLLPSRRPSYVDKHVVSLHCYHNLAFVCKGLNNEGSTRVVDGKLDDS